MPPATTVRSRRSLRSLSWGRRLRPLVVTPGGGLSMPPATTVRSRRSLRPLVVTPGGGLSMPPAVDDLAGRAAVLGAGNDLVLHCRGQIVEVGAVAGDPHDQAAVAIGVQLGVDQLVDVDDVVLDLHAASLEVAAGQRVDDHRALRTADELRIEALVAREPVADMHTP